MSALQSMDRTHNNSSNHYWQYFRRKPTCHWLYRCCKSIWLSCTTYLFRLCTLANAPLLGDCNLPFWWLQKCGDSNFASCSFNFTQRKLNHWFMWCYLPLPWMDCLYLVMQTGCIWLFWMHFESIGFLYWRHWLQSWKWSIMGKTLFPIFGYFNYCCEFMF